MAVDRLGEVAFANRQAAALMGLKQAPAALVGRGYGEVVPPEVAAMFREALATGERIDREIKVGDLPVRVEISRVADGHQGTRGVVAMLHDQTLRARMEQMSQRAERFRALLEMSAGMAHEIRNPLASIRGAAQELEGVRFPNEDDRRLLNVVMRESDRLDKIITDFLEYASDRPLDFALVNLPDVLREVAILLEARDADRRMEIVQELPRTLVCRGDADKLKQVFLNLGLNALEAIGERGRLTVRALPAGAPADPAREGARVEFEDTGHGIVPEDLARIFDPFFTTKPRGTGMGLAIARKIVQAHDGAIAAESAPGKGTTVRVWLPAS
jgi:signal transduction histidine kinase